MSYLALAKQVAAHIDEQRREKLNPTHPSSLSPQDAEMNGAVLEAEEVLFRLWWRTLPNKQMAKENFEAELAYYGAQKRFKKPFLEALKASIQDLR